MIQTAISRTSNRRSSISSLKSSTGIEVDQNGQATAEISSELDRLRKEKIATIYEIERYKKRISLAIVFALIGFAVGIGMIIWRSQPIEPGWEELRSRLMSTNHEKRGLCTTKYPDSYEKDFNVSETGEPLLLTPFIINGTLREAVQAARVTNIFQTLVSVCQLFLLCVKNCIRFLKKVNIHELSLLTLTHDL